jgi:hypothetical protein
LKEECFDDLIEDRDLGFESSDGVSSLEEKLRKIISYLPNWKTPGIDKVFNFFIKNLTSLHNSLIQTVSKMIRNPEEAPEWFYITYLIPKVEEPESPAQYRPITCMSNLYKLVTKLVTHEIRDFVEINKILSKNQLGTVRDCQGAKEQALLNKCINTFHSNNLSTMWIDVKKAYDSVDHKYLLLCLEKLGIPSWCISFVSHMVNNWKVKLSYNKEVISEVKLGRGILQGDSLSPLLFILNH